MVVKYIDHGGSNGRYLTFTDDDVCLFFFPRFHHCSNLDAQNHQILCSMASGSAPLGNDNVPQHRPSTWCTLPRVARPEPRPAPWCTAGQYGWENGWNLREKGDGDDDGDDG